MADVDGGGVPGPVGAGIEGAESGGDEAEEFFAAVARTHPRCFWLDGGGAREWSGRRSMIGWLEPEDVSLTFDATRREVTRHAGGVAEVVGSDPFAVLEAELAAGRADDQWFGYFGYAARADLPARGDGAGAGGDGAGAGLPGGDGAGAGLPGGDGAGAGLPDGDGAGAGLPDAVWMRCRHLRFFSHPPAEAGAGGASGQASGHESQAGGEIPNVRPQSAAAGGVVRSETPSAVADRAAGRATGRATEAGAPADTQLEAPAHTEPSTPPAYATAFARVQEHLHAGNSYEVNLTHRISRTPATPADPASTYLRLRSLNPAPYAGFLQHGVPGATAWLLSSSPERYALVTADGVLETKPIKGTTPRYDDPARDERAREDLANGPKYRAENLMIVDLLRNDLALVCRPGTVEVPALMEVESYATVHQLVSTVRGRLRDDVTTVGALRALFPAGSMTGAPKLRTMQIIDEVEATPRGAYAGAFGWIAADGRADLGVVIRSLMSPGDGTWTLGTGGGITVQSDVEEEWAETVWKAERLLRALG